MSNTSTPYIFLILLFFFSSILLIFLFNLIRSFGLKPLFPRLFSPHLVRPFFLLNLVSSLSSLSHSLEFVLVLCLSLLSSDSRFDPTELRHLRALRRLPYNHQYGHSLPTDYLRHKCHFRLLLRICRLPRFSNSVICIPPFPLKRILCQCRNPRLPASMPSRRAPSTRWSDCSRYEKRKPVAIIPPEIR